MSNFMQHIQTWAARHYGLVVSEEKIAIHIMPLMAAYGLDEVHYLQALRTHQHAIVNDTLDALTVQESYFFRDASLFSWLKHHFLPELIRKKQQKNDHRLTMWSAGCACGEEMYSLAIYLHQLLSPLKPWQINLLGTDINEAALARARIAMFTRSSLRATDEVMTKNYFELKATAYVLKPCIRDMVEFAYFNIADGKHWQPHLSPSKDTLKEARVSQLCDLILCRNVFIYLNQQTIESALQHFYEHLVEDGVLLLGPSDLITYYNHPFSIEMVGDLCLLRKISSKKTPNVVTKDVPLPPNPSQPPYVQRLQDSSHQLRLIRMALDQKQYQDVLKQIDNYLVTYAETALINRYKGEALVSLGDRDTAILCLKKAMKLDPLDATSHFLYALIALDMKQNETAIEALQKALYIKHRFPEAAYHLGLLYLQHQQKALGMKWLQQALKFAQEQPEEKPSLNSDATMKQLITAIEASIAYYKEFSNE